MNSSDLIPLVLLMLLAVIFGAGSVWATFAVRWAREQKQLRQPSVSELLPTRFTGPIQNPATVERPEQWVAVRSRNLAAVQSALGLHHAKPCTWPQGMNAKLFIAPPVHGWIIITGSALPDPAEDEDDCFHFLQHLSRQLGHVQYFSANRAFLHHAWIQVEVGRVIRAYAWAGRTVWRQGLRTSAERELNLQAYDYEDPALELPPERLEALAWNVERVPTLAARWSIDPAILDHHIPDHAEGIAGELPRYFRLG